MVKTSMIILVIFFDRSWDKRRQYIRMVKAARKRNDLPKLKDKAHLMTFPIQKPASK